jgi:hypothetical protein
VKYESEGYPNDAKLPAYRKIGISYIGNFSGPFGSGVKNAPIPSYLIQKFAGKKWSPYEVRQSVSAIDSMIAGQESEDSKTLTIQASKLILLLQGKVYPDFACNSVIGIISKSSFVELQNAVRSRILELTIQLEASIPAAAPLAPPTAKPNAKEKETVTRITKQIVHGNVTNISNVQGVQPFGTRLRTTCSHRRRLR